MDFKGCKMEKRPLVSIIVGFFNAERFIQETIESVITQIYTNWELLLIDDGSTDGSTVIAHRFSERFPEKIRYLEHDGHRNHGVCVSRNLGIRKAKGDYIAILDADDVWFPHKLERQVAILNSHPEAGMVFGSSEYWTSWAGRKPGVRSDSVPDLGLAADTLYSSPSLLTLCYPLGRAMAPCPSDLLLPREILEATGGFEEEFTGIYQLYEDQAFLAKIYLTTSVFVSSECWNRYRLHPNSCCHVVMESGKESSVRLFFLNWLKEYLSRNKVNDIEIEKALNRAFLPYRHPILYSIIISPQNAVRRFKKLLKCWQGKQCP